MMHIYKTESLL